MDFMIDAITYFRGAEARDYDFAVLIPSWNNLSYLQLCLRSIQENSSTRIQVIVLVNEGQDGTADWLRSQPDLDFLHSPENLGICYGLNLGRSLVKAPYIVYMNDDMYALPGWDKALLDEIKALGTGLFMLSSTMIEPHSTGNSCVVVQDYGDRLENFRETDLLRDLPNLKRSSWSGSTWPPNVVHRDLWDLVGGLSVEFSPGMYSDPDFSKKLYEAGVRVFKGLGNSMVYHFGSKSTGRVKHNKGRFQFALKWGISARFFTSQVLRSGRPYGALARQFHLSMPQRILHRLKLLKTAWKTKIKI